MNKQVLLRNKPRLTYSGLTIILSNASRFDTVSLLSAGAGHLVNNYCLRPEYNIMQCDVRLIDDKSPFLEGTKCILLLGEQALWDWIPESRNNTLNEVRGSVYYWNDIPCIASFSAQDACDLKDYEQQNNPLYKNFKPDEKDYESDEEDFDSVKRHGSTRRSNYSFWLRSDIFKCKHILRNSIPAYPKPSYRIYPNSDEVIRVLHEAKDQYLYFDIETDYEEANMQCFAFSLDGKTIYCVPTLDWNYKPAYSSLYDIIRSIALAIFNNILVCHNGAMFDFFVLGYKYHIPIYRVYDTMIAHHRCFPDVEKSLGHCVSYWTWERFHKDQDSLGYQTKDQMMKRLLYCGKDIYTMSLVYKAIKSYAKTIPGLQHSIDTAQRSIKPYLITTLQGISYDEKKVTIICKENDRLMMQYLRIIELLIGEVAWKEIRSQVKGKAKAFAGSNTQCCYYFHDMLGYAIQHRSDKTGKPSLGKKYAYKLALAYPDNPVIQFVLAYRTLAKETGTLKFVPWRDNDNKIVDYNKFISTNDSHDGKLAI